MTGEEIACMLLTVAWASLWAHRTNKLFGMKGTRNYFYELHQRYNKRPMEFANLQMAVTFIALVFIMVGLFKFGVLIIFLFSLSHLLSFFMGKPQ